MAYETEWANAYQCNKWKITTFRTKSRFPWRRYAARAHGYRRKISLDGVFVDEPHAQIGIGDPSYGKTRDEAEAKIKARIRLYVKGYENYLNRLQMQTKVVDI